MIRLLTSLFLIFTAFNFAAAQAKPARQSAIFYQISGKNLVKPSYLFGTHHAVCSADMLPIDKARVEISKADQVVMELDMDDPDFTASVGKDLAMPEGKMLTDLLTPAQYEKVDEVFRNLMGVPVDTVKMVKPNYLAVMLSTSPKAIGCSSPTSYDVTLAKAAVDKNIPIYGLETALYQVKILDYKPYSEQALDLYKLAANPQKSFDEMKALVDAYKSQDAEKLYALTIKASADDKLFQTRVITDRNKDWVGKIEEMIAKKSTFVAVGAAHLGGPKGLVTLLRAAGYKLTPIWLEAAK